MLQLRVAPKSNNGQGWTGGRISARNLILLLENPSWITKTHGGVMMMEWITLSTLYAAFIPNLTVSPKRELSASGLDLADDLRASLEENSRTSICQGGAAGRKSSKNRIKGHAILEAALLVPWLIFLFIGAFDVGFYSYALICAENAVRVAAEYTATSNFTADDSDTACTLALKEFASVPNLNGVKSCGSLPLIVRATTVTEADGSPASEVSVQYQSSQLIPIPGLLSGRLTVTRVAQMRIRS
jgi:hypothetical protein